MFQPTHTLNGEPVKVIRWNKDGDHPMVERYPVERRNFKGLLRVPNPEGGKDIKFALRFGEHIVEDEKGRITVVSSQTLPSEYVPLEGQLSGAVVAAIALVGFALMLLLGGPSASDFALGLAGVTHLMYYSSLLAQWNGSANIFDLDEAADDIKVAITTNTYAPNQDTHDFFDDITNEVTGTNYTAGGTAIASQLLTRSTGTVTFDGNDVVWTQSGAGFTNGRKFVVYRNSGAAATSRLFSVVTADQDVGNVAGDLTLAWHTNGIAQWTTT